MPRRFLANLPLVLQMPKDRAAWEKAAAEGTKVLQFRTIPSANKVRRNTISLAQVTLWLVHGAKAAPRCSYRTWPFFTYRLLLLRTAVASTALVVLFPHSDVSLASPSFAQIEIRQMLERLYGLRVEKVDTLNREGQMKRNPRFNYYYRVPDIKVAYVTLREAVKFPPPPEAAKTEEKKGASA